MTGPTPQTTAKPEQKPRQRRPEVGDNIRFVGWLSSEAALHAVVSRVYGINTVNLAYLTGGATWMSATSVRYDPTGTANGSWHFPGDVKHADA